MSLYFDDLANMQFDGNWLNEFVIDEDPITSSAECNDYISATGDSTSEQLVLDPTSVEWDSFLSDADTSLEIIESQLEADRSRSSTRPVLGTTRTFQQSLGPLPSRLPTCTEEVAFNYCEFPETQLSTY